MLDLKLVIIPVFSKVLKIKLYETTVSQITLKGTNRNFLQRGKNIN
jgi:hypothetical protein